MECPFFTNIEKRKPSMSSADRQISFKMSSELADNLGRIANKMDVNMSKMVRGCLLLGMPVFEKNPMLLDVIDTINSYRKCQSNNGVETV